MLEGYFDQKAVVKQVEDNTKVEVEGLMSKEDELVLKENLNKDINNNKDQKQDKPSSPKKYEDIQEERRKELYGDSEEDDEEEDYDSQKGEFNKYYEEDSEGNIVRKENVDLDNLSSDRNSGGSPFKGERGGNKRKSKQKKSVLEKAEMKLSSPERLVNKEKLGSPENILKKIERMREKNIHAKQVQNLMDEMFKDKASKDFIIDKKLRKRKRGHFNKYDAQNVEMRQVQGRVNKNLIERKLNVKNLKDYTAGEMEKRTEIHTVGGESRYRKGASTVIEDNANKEPIEKMDSATYFNTINTNNNTNNVNSFNIMNENRGIANEGKDLAHLYKEAMNDMNTDLNKLDNVRNFNYIDKAAEEQKKLASQKALKEIQEAINIKDQEKKKKEEKSFEPEVYITHHPNFNDHSCKINTVLNYKNINVKFPVKLGEILCSIWVESGSVLSFDVDGDYNLGSRFTGISCVGVKSIEEFYERQVKKKLNVVAMERLRASKSSVIERFSGHNFGCLLGRIGSENTYFPVSSFHNYTAKESGPLLFSINFFNKNLHYDNTVTFGDEDLLIAGVFNIKVLGGIEVPKRKIFSNCELYLKDHQSVSLLEDKFLLNLFRMLQRVRKEPRVFANNLAKILSNGFFDRSVNAIYYFLITFEDPDIKEFTLVSAKEEADSDNMYRQVIDEEERKKRFDFNAHFEKEAKAKGKTQEEKDRERQLRKERKHMRNEERKRRLTEKRKKRKTEKLEKQKQQLEDEARLAEISPEEQEFNKNKVEEINALLVKYNIIQLYNLETESERVHVSINHNRKRLKRRVRKLKNKRKKEKREREDILTHLGFEKNRSQKGLRKETKLTEDTGTGDLKGDRDKRESKASAFNTKALNKEEQDFRVVNLFSMGDEDEENLDELVKGRNKDNLDHLVININPNRVIDKPIHNRIDIEEAQNIEDSVLLSKRKLKAQEDTNNSRKESERNKTQSKPKRKDVDSNSFSSQSSGDTSSISLSNLKQLKKKKPSLNATSSIEQDNKGQERANKKGRKKIGSPQKSKIGSIKKDQKRKNTNKKKTIRKQENLDSDKSDNSESEDKEKKRDSSDDSDESHDQENEDSEFYWEEEEEEEDDEGEVDEGLFDDVKPKEKRPRKMTKVRKRRKSSSNSSAKYTYTFITVSGSKIDSRTDSFVSDTFSISNTNSLTSSENTLDKKRRFFNNQKHPNKSFEVYRRRKKGEKTSKANIAEKETEYGRLNEADLKPNYYEELKDEEEFQAEEDYISYFDRSSLYLSDDEYEEYQKRTQMNKSSLKDNYHMILETKGSKSNKENSDFLKQFKKKQSENIVNLLSQAEDDPDFRNNIADRSQKDHIPSSPRKLITNYEESKSKGMDLLDFLALKKSSKRIYQMKLDQKKQEEQMAQEEDEEEEDHEKTEKMKHDRFKDLYLNTKSTDNKVVKEDVPEINYETERKYVEYILPLFTDVYYATIQILLKDFIEEANEFSTIFKSDFDCVELKFIKEDEGPDKDIKFSPTKMKNMSPQRSSINSPIKHDGLKEEDSLNKHSPLSPRQKKEEGSESQMMSPSPGKKKFINKDGTEEWLSEEDHKKKVEEEEKKKETIGCV
eukprot:CAMPEP_0170523482 /NCGR_PEP_ID=MMETSP0209-20121228/8883_1 /TAXON_ID=665100 ORGANISM="Litonotus pictus, Strain P1" /NCGR_SAMPLE_ID=MMETSP0209 /ASSEMBLY_ACC=CAM_ASM_000301 /LENGTH=1591 /DNA_ID=CAMNT_0010811569 /DNA_START=192 /DNA_END=4968 /DNA_ORIENTATION=-